MRPRLLIIDNYDSFTYNLAQLFETLNADVHVLRNDAIDCDGIEALKPDCLCISPGPGRPRDAGISADVVRRFGNTVPILGVCLGMQVINEVFDGETIHAPVPVHGKRCTIHHNGTGLFEGLPSPFSAARYHSLAVRIRSGELAVTAHSDDETIMALRHHLLPLFGVQFHPESFLTEYGLELAGNFLALSQKGMT